MIDAALLLSSVNYSSLPNAANVPNPYPIAVGNLVTFQQAGVVLGPLDFDDTNLRYTVVISGQFTLTRTAGTLTLNPGDIITCANGDSHTFTSLSAGQLFNGLKYVADFGTLSSDITSLTTQVQALAAEAAQLKINLQALTTLEG